MLAESVIYSDIDPFFEFPPQAYAVVGEGVPPFELFERGKYVTRTAPYDTADTSPDILPEFDLEVSAQDENPYKTMEYNQLALQLFQMGFFRADMADQALRCLELMDFKNKDQLTAAILQGKQQAAMAQTAEGAASGGGTAVKQTAMERMRQQTHEAVRPR